MDEQPLQLIDDAKPVNRLAPGAVTPDRLLELAVMNGADLAQMSALMEMKIKWDAHLETQRALDAKKAYIAAKAAFKAENVAVRKDKENAQFGSRYASIGNLVDTVTPFLSKHGLSVDWKVDQSDGISVVCKMEHAMGHSETTSIKLPLDDSGKKNAIQQIKSTITYARVVTFENICGIATTEGNLDDDGNAAGAKQLLSEGQMVDFKALMDAAATVGELKDAYLKAVEAATEINDAQAVREFTEAKEAKLAKVKKGAK